VRNKSSGPVQQARPWRFFALAFILSWLFWIPAAVLSQRETSFPLEILFLLGGFGPSTAGVVMVYRTQGRQGRLDFLRRTFSFRRIGAPWYAFILLVFPLLTAASIGIEILLKREAPFFPDLVALVAEPQLLLWLPVFALQVTLLGPLSEKLGWRGYALDALQARWSALLSSVALGLLWSLWHLPLFFIRDAASFYYEWGFGTTLFWLFILRMTLLSIPITWVYNNNQRSILSAVLLHFAYNFTFIDDFPA